MTTALERGEGSASRLGHSLPPGKTRYPLYRRLGGPQGRSGQVQKISPPPGFDPRTVQPVYSRYTNYATQHTRRRSVMGILKRCVFPSDSVVLLCGDHFCCWLIELQAWMLSHQYWNHDQIYHQHSINSSRTEFVRARSRYCLITADTQCVRLTVRDKASPRLY